MPQMVDAACLPTCQRNWLSVLLVGSDGPPHMNLTDIGEVLKGIFVQGIRILVMLRVDQQSPPALGNNENNSNMPTGSKPFWFLIRKLEANYFTESPAHHLHAPK